MPTLGGAIIHTKPMWHDDDDGAARLAGLLIADSLSMPVHWYYNPMDIRRDFGIITTYQPPRARHPSSIMSLSNTGGHGRGDQRGRIIGG